MDNGVLGAFDFVKKFGLDKTAAQMNEEEKQLILAENKILADRLKTQEAYTAELERIIEHLGGSLGTGKHERQWQQ
jgi:hypothetical protein